ncbi:MAG: LptF/LptG family permease [Bacteroidetes bacterium]|nr:LptF/LptG family permease [Bacteroidota bacterium]
MTTFDRYILRRFVAAAALLMGLLVVFFVVLDYVEYIDDFLDRGATIRQVFGTYYLNYIPEIIKLTSPLALFLAAIYTTSRLSQSMQLAAMTMAGVSLYRLMAPFVVVGVLFTVGMLFFNGFVVPKSTGTVLDFQQRYYRDAPDRAETSEIYRQTAPGSVLAIGFFDPGLDRAFRVSLFDFEADTTDGVAGPERLVRRLDAGEMTWNDTTLKWSFTDPIRRTFLPDGSERLDSLVGFDTTLSVLPRDIAQTESDAERLTIAEAGDYVASLRRAGASRLGRPLVDFHAKLAYPLANLILVLIGVPLAARRRRGGQAVQFALGLLVAFVYLAMQKIAEPFGYAETIPPALAAWLPHAVFLLIALVLLARAPK